jgi:hypothetical protein
MLIEFGKIFSRSELTLKLKKGQILAGFRPDGQQIFGILVSFLFSH